MSFRAFASETLSALIDFGRLVASKSGPNTKEALVDIEGNDAEERVRDQSLWGLAPIMYRPADPTSAGACEAVFVRRGEDFVPVATRDLRFQVDLEKGEVVVRNFSASAQSLIRLRPDGVLVVEANEIRLGDAGATNTIALGNILTSHLDSIKSTYDGHSHPAVTTATIGSSATLGTVTISPPTTPFASTPDIESRHKVEN